MDKDILFRLMDAELKEITKDGLFGSDTAAFMDLRQAVEVVEEKTPDIEDLNAARVEAAKYNTPEGREKHNEIMFQIYEGAYNRMIETAAAAICAAAVARKAIVSESGLLTLDALKD